MKRILAFGNPFLAEDNLALKLADEIKLEDYEFVKSENPQELMDQEDLFAIMDVTFGINEVRMIDDIRMIKPQKMSSLHDFDLSFYLKLMFEMKKIEKLRMIAIPARMDLNQAKKEVEELLSNSSMI